MQNLKLKIVFTLLLASFMAGPCSASDGSSVIGLGVGIFVAALLVIAGIVIILRLGKRRN